MSGLLSPSEAATLAIHATGLLANAPDGSALTTAEMAAAIGASEAHMSKVLQRLAHAGILVGRRGPRGGFRLAAAPSTVTILRVYEAVDGPLPRGGCLLGVPHCPAGACPLESVMAAVGEQVARELAGLSVEDLGRSFRRRAVRRAARPDATGSRKKATAVRRARR